MVGNDALLLAVCSVRFHATIMAATSSEAAVGICGRKQAEIGQELHFMYLIFDDCYF
jgi:polysaccharide pyruvyl transferase WcaK-like protein